MLELKLKNISKIPGKILIFAYSTFLLVPIFFIVVTAFKTPGELVSNPLGLPNNFNFSNFSNAFQQAKMGSAGLNSLIISVSTVAIALVCCVIVTYCIFKLYNYKIGIIIYAILIISMMIPGVGMVTLIRLYRTLNLYNHLLGPILQISFGSLPLSVFLFLGFLVKLPKDIFDSLSVDGCGDFKGLFFIIVPLCKPVLSAITIFVFFMSWNNLLSPLILLRKPELYTLPIVMYTFRSTYTVQYTLMFAAVLMSGIPPLLLYYKFQNNFVNGLTGSVKG